LVVSFVRRLAQSCAKKPQVSQWEEKMRSSLLAGALFLTVCTLGSAAQAQRFEFAYTGSLVTFTVPINGTYQIIAFGAQGGSGNGRTEPASAGISVGGKGAEVGGNFNLSAGEILKIAVGGMGLSEVFGDGVGGGGGSFVVGPGEAPLVIAGGGGGGGAGSPFIGVCLAEAASPLPAMVRAVMAGSPSAMVPAVAAAVFSAPAVLAGTAMAETAPAAVHGLISPAVAPDIAEARAAATPPEAVAVVVAAVCQTRAQTRSWSAISGPETAKS
jgi:hypothetical protein